MSRASAPAKFGVHAFNFVKRIHDRIFDLRLYGFLTTKETFALTTRPACLAVVSFGNGGKRIFIFRRVLADDLPEQLLQGREDEAVVN